MRVLCADMRALGGSNDPGRIRKPMGIVRIEKDTSGPLRRKAVTVHVSREVHSRHRWACPSGALTDGYRLAKGLFFLSAGLAPAGGRLPAAARYPSRSRRPAGTRPTEAEAFQGTPL